MMNDQASWQDTVTLPVGYVDEGTGSLHNQATLRKMTGNEEALLVDPKFRGNGGKLITALLSSCVTSLDGMGRVDASVMRRLSSADRNYLLLQLRRLTFGDQMEAHYRCPRCQGTTEVTEDLSAIDVRTASDALPREVQVTLLDGYQDTDGRWHREFVFGLPTGEDEEAAGSQRDRNPSRQRDVLLARCLKQVGDMEPRRVQATGVRIFAALSMADRRLIQKALDASAPGTDLTRTIVCDHCGEEFRTTLDISHFFPLG